MLKSIAGLILLGAVGSATATELMVHIATEHYGTKKMLNEFNLGLAVRFDSGVILGAYHNSYEKTSSYVGYDYRFSEYVGVAAMIVHGYKNTSRADKDKDLKPAAALTLTLPLTEKFSLRVLATPPVNGHTGIVHGMVTYRFGN